jgi:hypothetical protein
MVDSLEYQLVLPIYRDRAQTVGLVANNINRLLLCEGVPVDLVAGSVIISDPAITPDGVQHFFARTWQDA